MRISEELGRHGSFSALFGGHTGIGTLPIIYFGTEAQKKKYLSRLSAGELVSCYALTEPEAGSDALNIKTKAIKDPTSGVYILNGTKQFITNAGIADIIILFAKVDGDKFTAFIVPKDTQGITIGPEEKKMGLKGSSTCSIILEDVKLSAESILGKIGKGHEVALNILNLGRLKLAVAALGALKEVLKECIEYSTTRHQFGLPIASFGAIKEKIAQIVIQAYALESMSYRVASLIEAKLSQVKGQDVVSALEEFAVECSIVKVFGSECLDFAVDEGVQIHGGYGYIEEYMVERAYRDSRINRIFEGTNEINRLFISLSLIKKASAQILKIFELAQDTQEKLKQKKFSGLGRWDKDLMLMSKVIEHIKRVFAINLSLSLKRYGQEIKKEQMILFLLSDIAIELFAAESVVQRTIRVVQSFGQDKAGMKISISKVFLSEVLERIFIKSRRILGNILSLEELRQALMAQNALLDHVPVRTIPEKRAIADQAIQAGRYWL
jgi:hypothetical protein